MRAIEVDGTETTILDKKSEVNALERRYQIPVGREIKGIKYILTGKSGAGDFPGAWAALAEIKALREKEVAIEAVNVALDKPVTGSEAQSGKPLSNITDGKEDTLWISNGGVIPANAQIDLINSYFVENIELTFEKEGLPFQFYVDVIDSNNVVHTVLDMRENDTVIDRKYTIPVGKNIKSIDVKITGNNGQGNAYLAWPAIAEVKAYSKQENVALNAIVNPDTGAALVDGNETSGIVIEAEDAKEYVIDFGKIVDINTIETIGKADGGLKYTVEYRSMEDENEWISFLDKSANTNASEKLLTELKNPVTTNAVKVKFINESFIISEFKAYKADTTGKLLTYIGELEKTYNSAIVGELSGQYPQEAKDALLLAINDAKDASTKGINSIEVDQEIAKLKTALNSFYSQVVTINRRPLLTAVSDANIVLNALKDTLNTDEKLESKAIIDDRIAKLEAGIAEANGVYETKSVTQGQLNEAEAKLRILIEEGYAELDAHNKYKVELSIAEDRVNNAVAGEGNGQYLQSDIDVLKASIIKLKADYEIAKTVEEVNSITESLKKAVKDFEAKVIEVNKESLANAIADAEEVANNADGKYYSSAIEVFINEINSAKAIFDDANASQSSVNNAVKYLLDAQAKLLEAILPDKTELKNLVNDANTLVKKLQGYNSLKDLKEELEDAIKNANIVIENENATAEQIAEVTNVLKNSIRKSNDSIKEFESVSKSELQDTIDKAEALNKKDYTKNSYSVLEEAIKEAKKLINKKEVTQSEVDAATARINNAIKNLVKINQDNNGGNNNGGSNNSGSNNSGNNNGSINNGSNNSGNNNNGNSNLPQTGGASPIVTLVLGSAVAAAGGLFLKKKKED